MRLVRKFLGLAALLAFAPLVAQGPAPQPKVETESSAAVAAAPTPGGGHALTADDLSAWLDGLVPYALARGDIAGAVVTVVRGNEVLFERGYGYADVAKRKPVSPQSTLFRPGSVSKLFTWTAVMQLVEQGKIDLDADVNAYLDFEIPSYDGKPITMRQIMTHTAGFEESLRHLIGDDPATVMSLDDYVREGRPERVFAPGTTPAYSNYATALAGYIVQRRSGMPFDDYVEQKIFAPLGMADSSFRQPLPRTLAPMMSKGYELATKPAKPYEIVYPAPAGSLASTGADMAKFMIAHLNGGGPLMSPRTAAMMHDYRAPGIDHLDTMALGFYEQWVNGHRAIAHGGDTDNFHSYLWLFPEEKIGIFFSMNSQGTPGSSLAVRGALFHQFADRYLPGPEPRGQVDEATAREHAAMMAGNYSSSRGPVRNFLSILDLLGQTTVSVDGDGKLVIPGVPSLADQPRDWEEVEPFVWLDRSTGERLAAEVNGGKVTRFSTDMFSPFTVLMRAPWQYNAAWLLPALMLALGIVAITAIAWPWAAVARRRYGVALTLEGPARLSYRLSRGFAWLALAAMLGWIALVTAMMSDLNALGGTYDWALYLLQILTPIALLGLVGLAGWYGWTVWTGGRKWGARLWSVLLVLSALLLLYVGFAYHLIDFGTRY
ncbi:serine hydrolase [Novosphingobium sp. PC22D]|uniref:serine hydrolase domain-containing protein n=1 Tax=Novosphingobium sp. PC22D TaxID=1962403 RepID=UPI000BF23863|nr:serine hydrolase domain-containing protein [Novosphingobium sp. PC22D]PEQ14065.1 serine hydrolase [Novosphingobium sp. PC22D]